MLKTSYLAMLKGVETIPGATTEFIGLFLESFPTPPQNSMEICCVVYSQSCNNKNTQKHKNITLVEVMSGYVKTALFTFGIIWCVVFVAVSCSKSYV